MSLLSGVIRNQGATEANPVEKAQSCEKRQRGQKIRQKDAEMLRGPKRVKFWGPKGDAPGVTLRTTR